MFVIGIVNSSYSYELQDSERFSGHQYSVIKNNAICEPAMNGMISKVMTVHTFVLFTAKLPYV